MALVAYLYNESWRGICLFKIHVCGRNHEIIRSFSADLVCFWGLFEKRKLSWWLILVAVNQSRNGVWGGSWRWDGRPGGWDSTDFKCSPRDSIEGWTTNDETGKNFSGCRTGEENWSFPRSTSVKCHFEKRSMQSSARWNSGTRWASLQWQTRNGCHRRR